MLMNFENLISKYKLNIKGVLHIGANSGEEYPDYLRNRIYNMIFFEPLINSYNKLLNNIQIGETVKAYNIAIGNMSGETEIYISSNGGASSSVLEPLQHKLQYPQITFNGKEKVKIEKIDNIEFNRDMFNMMNIDVQGYELEVLKGSIDTLKHIDYIMSEINKVYLYKNCVLESELDSFLFNFGFIRVETYWAGGTWGDALYIKK